MPSLSAVSNWAITEFAEAELGDWRRTQRLVDLAARLAHHPSATRPEAGGHGAMPKSADRFFANDDIAPYDLLQSHPAQPSAVSPRFLWCWRCKIPRQLTGQAIRLQRAWGRSGRTRARDGLSIVRWPSRPSASPWACWPTGLGAGPQRYRQERPPQTTAHCPEGKPAMAGEPGGRLPCPGQLSCDPHGQCGRSRSQVDDLLAAERPDGVDLLIRAA